MDKTTQEGWKTVRFNGSTPKVENETIAIEYPMTVMINGEEFATMVCTPTDVRDLVIGFLASEGMIRFFDDIKSIQIDEEQGFAHIELFKSLDDYEHDHSKRFIGSCCGKSRQFYFKSDVQTARTVTTKLTVTAGDCHKAMEELQSSSDHFQKTGGVHNAALWVDGELVVIRTDIGRHNALDKIYGHVVENNIRLTDALIVFSGRMSSEVILKISKMGIGIIVSKSAPTDLALKLADDLGITAIGFVRKNKMNVYTHPFRIKEAANISLE